ncbi:MAG: hypothetical protein AB1439_07575 [candidate division FCPU426 bacterium]
MKCVVWLLLLMLLSGWAPLLAAQDAREARMEKLARQHYGENLRGFAPSADPVLAEAFKGYAVYRVDVFNPQSRLAGRTILERTLVAPPKGEPVFLESFQEVVAFLNSRPVVRKFALKQVVLAFASLGRVKILNRPGDLGGEATPQERAIAPPVYQVAGGKQHARFYVLADPNITSVLRIDLDRSAVGKLRFKTEWISSRGGYD